MFTYMSPRLQERPSARLSLAQELPDYLSSLPQETMVHVERLQESLGGPEPDPLAIEACVMVPVHVAQDGKTFGIHGLEQYAAQTIDPDRWVLYPYFNATGHEPATLDGVTDIIGNARRRFPHLPIRDVSHIYMRKTRIGGVRADNWDVPLLDLAKLGIHGEIIGFSHDADAKKISPDLLETTLDAAKSHPEKDIFTSRLSWAIEGNPDADINRVLRWYDFLCDLPQLVGMPFVPDSNAGIALSTYTAVGGFDRDCEVGEMNGLRLRIANARAGLPIDTDSPPKPGYYDIVQYVEGPYITTNSRRIYNCLLRGLSPDDGWDQDGPMPFTTEVGDTGRQQPTIEAIEAPIALDALRELVEKVNRCNAVDEIGPVYLERAIKIGHELLRLP